MADNTRLPFGFNYGSGPGNRDGLGNYTQRLDDAGIPFTIMSADDMPYDEQEIAKASDTKHFVGFRRSVNHGDVPPSGDVNVPDYNKDPITAAREHAGWAVAHYPQELDGNITWCTDINEPRHKEEDHPGIMEWLAQYSIEAAKIHWDAGYKYVALNFAGGNHPMWEDAGTKMKELYQLAQDNSERLMIGTHEYSWTPDDIMAGNGSLVGRIVEQLLDYMPHVPVVITEFGWSETAVPEPAKAIQDYVDVYETYYNRGVRYAATWYLGPGFKDIADDAQKLIAPLTDKTLEYVGDPVTPDPPVEPPPIDPENPVVLNPCFTEGWTTIEHGNQVPVDWQMGWYEVGDMLPNGKTVTRTPEVVHKLASQLPPDEQPGGENELILCGDTVYKAFGSNGIWGVVLSPTFKGLIANSTYKFKGYYQVHYQNYLNPEEIWDFTVDLSVGNARVGYGTDVLKDREWVQLEVEGKTNEVGTLLVFIQAYGAWENSRDIFFDKFEIEYVSTDEPSPPCDEPRIGDARVPYNRTYYRVNSSATKDEFLSTAELAYDSKSTVGFSADDAGIGVGLKDKFIVEVGNEFDNSTIEKWYKFNYGVENVDHMGYPDGGTEPPVDPPVEPPTGNSDVKYGIHTSADSILMQGDEAMLEAISPNTIKFLSGFPQDQVARVVAKHQHATYIVRAFLSFGGRDVSPDQFYEWTISDVVRTVDTLVAHGVPRDRLYLELHNEPNLVPEGLLSSWQNGAEFGAWLIDVANRYREALGAKVQLLYPGLSPGEEIADVRQESKAFFEASKFALTSVDAVALHGYWSPGYDWQTHPYAIMQTVDWYNQNAGGMELHITEACNNSGSVSRTVKANQYTEVWNALKQKPNVETLSFFVLSASNPDWGDGGTKETWDMNMAQIAGAR